MAIDIRNNIERVKSMTLDRVPSFIQACKSKGHVILVCVAFPISTGLDNIPVVPTCIFPANCFRKRLQVLIFRISFRCLPNIDLVARHAHVRIVQCLRPCQLILGIEGCQEPVQCLAGNIKLLAIISFRVLCTAVWQISRGRSCKHVGACNPSSQEQRYFQYRLHDHPLL